MSTIYDIAKKAGVSPSTVSKVINDYGAIPEGTKKRVRQVMEEMNYIPNVSARSLSKGKSRNIGILAYFGMRISPFKHSLFTEILDSFQTEVNLKNYELLFVSNSLDGKDGTFLKNCIARDVAGVLLFGDFENPEMVEVIESNIPKVAFDYEGEVMNSVQSDNYAKMKEMTAYLLSLGHRNIVFVHGEASGFTSKRTQGFRDAFFDAGIPFDESMLVENPYLDLESLNGLIRSILKRKNRPTAIMFPDDYSAIAGIKILRQLGLSCPKDISVTGFDGLPVSQMVTPSLTTIKQDTVTIGKTLADMLIHVMRYANSEIRHLEIPAELIKGESVRSLL